MLVFADTNLLVYAKDAADPEKQDRALEWIRYLWDAGTGCLSTQVLSEYYTVTTRKLQPGLTLEEARADVRDLSVWRPVGTTIGLMEAAWVIEDRFSISWWDALVVAAAQAARCDVLLTEDLQHGSDLDGLVVLDPFQSEIADVIN